MESQVPPSSSEGAVKRGAARGGAWSAIGQAVTLLAALFATPFTVRLLGPARYGLWSLLQSTLTWIGLADFGMSGASTRMAGERLAQDDAAGEATLLWTSAAITIGATTVAAAAFAALAPVVVSQLLHIRGDLAGPAVVGLRLVAAASITGAAANTFNTPLVTRLRWSGYTLITAGIGLLQIIGVPVCLALLGGGVVAAAGVYLATSALTAAALLYTSLRLQPAMRRPRVSREAARKLLGYGAALTVAGVASIPLNTAERFLLGHYRSTTEVAYYTVAWRLATMLAVLPTAICQPLFPAFIALEGRGEHDAARRLYGDALRLLFLLVTPATMALACIAQPFLSVWAGHTYGVHSTDAFYVLVGSTWFNALAWLPIYYLSLNHTKLVAIVNAAQVLPYIVVAALLTSTVGVMGAAIASASRDIADAALLFWLSRRVTGMPLSPFTQHRSRSVGVILMLAALLALAASVTTSLPVRAFYAVVLIGIYGAVVWRIVLSSPERSSVGVLARNVVGRGTT